MESRRLSTDAKIVLERAGYIVDHWGAGKNAMLRVTRGARGNADVGLLLVTSGTVDNAAVKKLLDAVA